MADGFLLQAAHVVLADAERQNRRGFGTNAGARCSARKKAELASPLIVLTIRSGLLSPIASITSPTSVLPNGTYFSPTILHFGILLISSRMIALAAAGKRNRSRSGKGVACA